MWEPSETASDEVRLQRLVRVWRRPDRAASGWEPGVAVVVALMWVGWGGLLASGW